MPLGKTERDVRAVLNEIKIMRAGRGVDLKQVLHALVKIDAIVAASAGLSFVFNENNARALKQREKGRVAKERADETKQGDDLLASFTNGL